jgi:hypothetical protein
MGPINSLVGIAMERIPGLSSMASNYIINALTLDQNPIADSGYEIHRKSILPGVLHQFSPSVSWPTDRRFCILA